MDECKPLNCGSGERAVRVVVRNGAIAAAAAGLGWRLEAAAPG